MTMVDVESGRRQLLGGVIAIINDDGGCGKWQVPVARWSNNNKWRW